MRTLLLGCFTALTSILYSQTPLYQYFDGADTISGQALFIEVDTNAWDIWQVGPPQKNYFDAANTVPNVLITDTIDYLPDSTTSSFSFTLYSNTLYANAIMAIEWNQKLDLDTNTEMGLIEYSKDAGNTWINVFTDPNVYNFYGYNSGNTGAHHISGEEGFTGTDTQWKNVWLCFFTQTAFHPADSVIFKYTVKTDTAEHNSEGWMIDNFSVHPTWFHTIVENSKDELFEAYPTNTDGIVHVAYSKGAEQADIKQVELIDLAGRVVEVFNPHSLNFDLDLSKHGNGQYRLKIITNIGFDICPIVIQH